MVSDSAGPSNLVAAIVSPLPILEVHWSHWLRHPLLSVQKQLLKFPFLKQLSCVPLQSWGFANVFEGEFYFITTIYLKSLEVKLHIVTSYGNLFSLSKKE